MLHSAVTLSAQLRRSALVMRADMLLSDYLNVAKQNIWNMWNIVMSMNIAYERNYLPRTQESNTTSFK